MKKVKKSEKEKSREKISNPHDNANFYERLAKSGAIDLSDNYEIVDWNNGYISIIPLNPEKKITKPD